MRLSTIFFFRFDMIGEGTTPPHLFRRVLTRRHCRHDTFWHDATMCFDTTQHNGISTQWGGDVETGPHPLTMSHRHGKRVRHFSPCFHSHERGFPTATHSLLPEHNTEEPQLPNLATRQRPPSSFAGTRDHPHSLECEAILCTLPFPRHL